ncbi:30S ribosomal protein S6 [Sulfobacillus acidophilus TPY]|nr:30S ribosomal protein S6 [Sulfobacillus acidophilus TPY]
MYILKPDLGDEALQEDIEKFSQMIQTAGGAVEKTDKWGRRKLAYEIQGYTEGFYVVVNFTGSGDIANEITRILRINDDVIRSIVVRLDD